MVCRLLSADIFLTPSEVAARRDDADDPAAAATFDAADKYEDAETCVKTGKPETVVTPEVAWTFEQLPGAERLEAAGACVDTGKLEAAKPYVDFCKSEAAGSYFAINMFGAKEKLEATGLNVDTGKPEAAVTIVADKTPEATLLVSVSVALTAAVPAALAVPDVRFSPVVLSRDVFSGGRTSVESDSNTLATSLKI